MESDVLLCNLGKAVVVAGGSLFAPSVDRFPNLFIYAKPFTYLTVLNMYLNLSRVK